ncbi:MAG: hypothetical protein KAI97_01265 [Gemmatimonadetes bacterium]|nr:hypothetical protein [Gemmatimonadota bacterium]
MFRTVIVGVFATFALTMPVLAQDDAVENAEPEVTANAEPEVAANVDPAAEEEVVATHDWEFALQPTEHVPGGGGVVKVTEGDAGQALLVEVEGLPLVDELDQEDRDVNAYTVWIVPSKERVKESTLAGVVTVGPEGTGAFESTTALETFGIIVTATPDGAPEAISGVPVLTGIPVTSAPPAAPAEGEAAPAGDGDAVADEPPAEGVTEPEAEDPTDEEPGAAF